MATVLVSGAAGQVSAVAQALRGHGAEVVEVPDLGDVPAAAAAAGPAAFDAYVQLGASFRVEGATAIQRVRHFYAEGVLARFTALDAARPALRPGASVTFVMGQLPPEVTSDADRRARHSLTEVLGRAARADMAPEALVIRILPADTDPAAIAALSLGLTTVPLDPDAMPDLSLADWRIELMSATFVET